MRPRFAAALTFAGAILSSVQAIQTVTRAGRYLYTADGNRFYIKGVAYQEQGVHFPCLFHRMSLSLVSRRGHC